MAAPQAPPRGKSRKSAHSGSQGGACGHQGGAVEGGRQGRAARGQHPAQQRVGDQAAAAGDGAVEVWRHARVAGGQRQRGAPVCAGAGARHRQAPGQDGQADAGQGRPRPVERNAGAAGVTGLVGQVAPGQAGGEDGGGDEQARMGAGGASRRQRRRLRNGPVAARRQGGAHGAPGATPPARPPARGRGRDGNGDAGAANCVHIRQSCRPGHGRSVR